MLRFRSNFINGVQHLLFNHGFRELTLYSTSISTALNPNFVNYLVQNLGFSNQQAISTSYKLTRSRLPNGATKVSDYDIDLVNNANNVVSFLKKIGLEQSQIRNAIDISPLILVSNVDKTLNPKTEGLQKLGFSKPYIAEIVTVKPSILFMSLKNDIIPAIQALREIMGCDECHLITILKKSQQYSLSAVRKSIVPNVALLRSYGVPIYSIRKFLVRKPNAFVRKTDVFMNLVVSVEEKFGIPRDSRRFLYAVQVVSSLSEKTIESKRLMYKSFGWTNDDIALLVSLNPISLSISGDLIKKKLDFLMNELGYKPSDLALHSNILLYSLEKRVMPRHKVLVILKENGSISNNYSLFSAISHVEPVFRKKFVLPFKEVHEFYSKHRGISLEKLTQGLSKQNSSAL